MLVLPSQSPNAEKGNTAAACAVLGVVVPCCARGCSLLVLLQ